MKQTAVEWLQELIECGADLEQIKKSLPKEKELEKQQQGYSEEEVDFFVNNILHHIKCYEYNVNNLELISFSNDIEFEIEKLYEQFKKK